MYFRYGFVTFRTAEEARKVQEMVCLFTSAVNNCLDLLGAILKNGRIMCMNLREYYKT